MSAWLYFELVRWDGRGGTVHHCGRVVALSEAPHISGVRVEQIDYAPETNIASIRYQGQHDRDMTSEECKSAQALMRHLLPP